MAEFVEPLFSKQGLVRALGVAQHGMQVCLFLVQLEPAISELTSACKIFLAVDLLLCVKALCCRTAAWNQLNCRDSRPHSRMTHHERFVSYMMILDYYSPLEHRQQPYLYRIVHFFALS